MTEIYAVPKYLFDEIIDLLISGTKFPLSEAQVYQVILKLKEDAYCTPHTPDGLIRFGNDVDNFIKDASKKSEHFFNETGDTIKKGTEEIGKTIDKGFKDFGKSIKRAFRF